MLLAYKFRQWFWVGLDWLYPPVCGGCNRTGNRWCPDCQKQVQNIREPICEKCGQPLFHPGQCRRCKQSAPPYEALRSWAIFDGPIRNALHSLKYRRNIALGDSLARQLNEFAGKLGWPVDLVVPVPLGKIRTKDRGYNQVGLVARPLAQINKWHYVPEALVRKRETKSQVGLSVEERLENVTGAFFADPERVHGLNVLVIDDVATTGATLSACAVTLLEAGANRVYALTLARALPRHGLKTV